MKNQLTVLGSGTCVSSFYTPFDYRNPSGHLLQIAGKNILLDAGDGIRRKMEEAHFDYYNLDAICISHFHPDHFSIDALVQAIYGRAKREKKRKILSLYGPPELFHNFVALWDMKNIPSYEDSFPGVLDVTFHEYKHRESIYIGEIHVTAYKVLHGRMDAYALRIEYDKRIFVYSGDCAQSNTIIEAASDADTFLCESGNNIDQDKEESDHLSPYQAGLVALKAKAKKLILTHYSGKDTKEDMMREVKKAGFLGKVDIASDLDLFDL